MILDDIVEFKFKQIVEEKKKVSLEEYIKLGEGREIADFTKALSGDKMSIIAEIKKASPSRGVIKEDFDHKAIAEIYNEIDIDAISVLTESEFFKGNDDFIGDVKGITKKPVLRKDFIVDEYQIHQAKAIGADAVLLIAAILKGKLKNYYEIAREIGLHVLIEVHDREELEEALQSGGQIIGINNRDLKTFKEDLSKTEELIKFIPKDKIVVSESSIKTSADVKYLHGLGVKAVLIGETFMRNLDDKPMLDKFVSECKQGE